MKLKKILGLTLSAALAVSAVVPWTGMTVFAVDEQQGTNDLQPRIIVDKDLTINYYDENNCLVKTENDVLKWDELLSDWVEENIEDQNFTDRFGNEYEYLDCDYDYLDGQLMHYTVSVYGKKIIQEDDIHYANEIRLYIGDNLKQYINENMGKISVAHLEYDSEYTRMTWAGKYYVNADITGGQTSIPDGFDSDTYQDFYAGVTFLDWDISEDEHIYFSLDELEVSYDWNTKYLVGNWGELWNTAIITVDLKDAPVAETKIITIQHVDENQNAFPNIKNDQVEVDADTDMQKWADENIKDYIKDIEGYEYDTAITFGERIIVKYKPTTVSPPVEGKYPYDVKHIVDSAVKDSENYKTNDLDVTVSANDYAGYKVKEVRYDGQVIPANADGTYSVLLVNPNYNVIEIYYEEAVEEGRYPYDVKHIVDGAVKDSENYKTNDLDVTVSANDYAGYKVKEVRYDGQVIPANANGTYSVLLVNPNYNVIEIYYEEVEDTDVWNYTVKHIKDNYAVSTETLTDDNGIVTINPMTFEGYEVDRVLFRGEEIPAEANGTYKIALANMEYNLIEVYYAEKVEPTDPDDDDDDTPNYPYIPSNPGTEDIDDDETPLAPGSGEVIDDDTTPLAPSVPDAIPGSPEDGNPAGETIEDDDVAKTDAPPQTGRKVAGSLALLAGAAVVAAVTLKKREN